MFLYTSYMFLHMSKIIPMRFCMRPKYFVYALYIPLSLSLSLSLYMYICIYAVCDSNIFTCISRCFYIIHIESVFIRVYVLPKYFSMYLVEFHGLPLLSPSVFLSIYMYTEYIYIHIYIHTYICYIVTMELATNPY